MFLHDKIENVKYEFIFQSVFLISAVPLLVRPGRHGRTEASQDRALPSTEAARVAAVRRPESRGQGTGGRGSHEKFLPPEYPEMDNGVPGGNREHCSGTGNPEKHGRFEARRWRQAETAEQASHEALHPHQGRNAGGCLRRRRCAAEGNKE